VALRVVTPAAEEAALLSLEEARAQLRVDFDDQDLLIQGLIDAALDTIETDVHRRYFAQSLEWVCDTWPAGKPFPIAGGDGSFGMTVDSVTYIDLDGNAQVLDPSQYWVRPAPPSPPTSRSPRRPSCRAPTRCCRPARPARRSPPASGLPEGGRRQVVQGRLQLGDGRGPRGRRDRRPSARPPASRSWCSAPARSPSAPRSPPAWSTTSRAPPAASARSPTTPRATIPRRSASPRRPRCCRSACALQRRGGAVRRASAIGGPAARARPVSCSGPWSTTSAARRRGMRTAWLVSAPRSCRSLRAPSRCCSSGWWACSRSA
jgi:hypothetical protein